MLEDRALYLINAEIDGELDASEKSELAAVLERSEEARAMRAELGRIARLLDDDADIEPPANLSSRIMAQVTLPAPNPSFSLSAFWASLQPGPVAAAFAAGMLVSLGVYEFASRPQMGGDLGSMVGTMVANPQDLAAAARDQLAVNAPGVKGSVSLVEQGSFIVLNFDLDSAEQAEIVVGLTEAGLRFGGIAHTSDDALSVDGVFEVSGGTLRVVNQGRQAFTVFLSEAAGGSGGDGEIPIGVTMGGAPAFSGALHR